MKNLEKIFRIIEREFSVNSESPCKFHIGRGGRFHNPGHRTFKGFEILNHEYDDLFEGENGEALDDSRHEVSEKFGAKFGKIDIDGIYDTTYACRLDECNDDELLLIAEYCGIDSDLIDEDE